MIPNLTSISPRILEMTASRLNIAVATMGFLPITVVAVSSQPPCVYPSVHVSDHDPDYNARPQTISGSNALDFVKQEIGGGVSAWRHWWVFLLVAIVLTVAVSGYLLYQEI
ncbi:hypothetical protein F5Y00DRAFT_185450 [Daldinia vernicosa]|uniref:uncharacterized protein n=1 Tax=Daldinia vernicosa TaxID=114800 RepID=UPI002008DE07|nr:uncharacterized protein F5Y00DRAFT_185450 [Daldinia vernicosa]KAI0844892.1 hypothetical protein F5Y00DRAFT_185450 [Daldinia vernicosa]